MQRNDHISGKDQERPHNRFWWLGLIIVCTLLTAMISAIIYDSVSGLAPNSIMRTAVVEHFGRSGADGGAVSTSFGVRFDNGDRTSVHVPEGTLFRNGHRVLISERKSLVFGVKHHTFLKYID